MLECYGQSTSYYSPIEYVAHGAIEESSVELLTQELAKTLGLQHVPTYYKSVSILRNINTGLGLYEDDMEFAVKLFERPVIERFAWLQNRTNECIIHNNKVSMEEQDALYAQGRTKPGNIVTNVKGSAYGSQHQWGTELAVRY